MIHRKPFLEGAETCVVSVENGEIVKA